MATLKELRKQLGFTQAELARRSGLRQATLSALENGQNKPHSGTVLALANALETDEVSIQKALIGSQGRGGPDPADAIGQMGSDWPFLARLDADLRLGLASSLVAEWTHSSTALEGNTITVGDTLFVLTEGLTVSGKTLREHQELHGHAQALGQMMAWTRSGKQCRIEQLHELHRAVQTGTVIDSLAPVGRWKVEPNGTTAMTSKGTTEWHEYSHPRNVPALVEAWLKSLARSCRQPLLKEIKAMESGERDRALVDLYTEVHLGFVGIHPYADGNGRMARLLANIPLLRAGFPPLLVSVEQRREYLVLLGDYTLDRGGVSAGEELVKTGPERDALHAFFLGQWAKTLDIVERFHHRQSSREM